MWLPLTSPAVTLTQKFITKNSILVLSRWVIKKKIVKLCKISLKYSMPFLIQQASKLGIHRTVHAGESGPAEGIKLVWIFSEGRFWLIMGRDSIFGIPIKLLVDISYEKWWIRIQIIYNYMCIYSYCLQQPKFGCHLSNNERDNKRNRSFSCNQGWKEYHRNHTFSCNFCL